MINLWEIVVTNCERYYKKNGLCVSGNRYDLFKCKYKEKCKIYGANYYGAEAYIGDSAFNKDYLVIFLSLDQGKGSDQIESIRQRTKSMEKHVINDVSRLNKHMAGTIYTFLSLCKIFPGYEQEKKAIKKCEDKGSLKIVNNNIYGFGKEENKEIREYVKNIILLNCVKCCKGDSMSNMPGETFQYCEDYTKGELDVILNIIKSKKVILICQGKQAMLQISRKYKELLEQSTWEIGQKWFNNYGNLTINSNEIRIITGYHPSYRKGDIYQFITGLNTKISNF